MNSPLHLVPSLPVAVRARQAVVSVRHQGRELGVFASQREAEEAPLRYAPEGAEMVREDGSIAGVTKKHIGGAMAWLMVYGEAS